MAAESNTPVDIEIWIEKVVNSCENIKQLNKASKLIDLYIRQLRLTLPRYQSSHIEDRLDNIRLEQRDLIRNK
jgi:hypothetical protein